MPSVWPQIATTHHFGRDASWWGLDHPSYASFNLNFASQASSIWYELPNPEWEMPLATLDRVMHSEVYAAMS